MELLDNKDNRKPIIILNNSLQVRRSSSELNSRLTIPNNKHFIEHFLSLKENKSNNTAEAYECDIKDFFNVSDVRDINIENIIRITIFDVEDWIMSLTKEGYASSTINRKISCLSSLYHWLLKYRDNKSNSYIIKFNPFSVMKEEKPSITNKETENLTKSEVKRLLASIETDSLKGFRDKTILSLAITTALRKFEILNIKIKDIISFGEFHIINIVGKGSKADAVKLQSNVKELIDMYISRTGRSYEDNGDDYLFISHSNNSKSNNKKLNKNSLNLIIRDRCMKANIQGNITVHSLRHTAITLAIQAGYSIEQVRDFARHNSITTTNRYIHNNNKFKNYAGDGIDIF